MSQRYYIVDYGKDMVDVAEVLVNKLKDDNHHVVVYVTTMEYYVSAMEITEDEFLTHFELITEN